MTSCSHGSVDIGAMDSANDNDMFPGQGASADGLRYADLDDGLYRLAVSIVKTDRRASTSWVQRQLGIGYNTASRLIQRMERDGVIIAPKS